METKIKREYWSNGEVCSEKSYVGEELHGVSKWWWPSGQLRLEVPYVGGKWHGMEKWWHQNGGIDEFHLYNKGEQVARFNPKNETQRWKLK